MESMKTTFSLFFGILFLAFLPSPDAFSQKAEVEKVLKEYNIPEDFFIDNLSEEDATHSFKLQTTTVTGETTSISESFFDPARPDGDRWSLLMIDGREPTEKEKKQFHKTHNKDEESDYGEPADEDWTILEDNDSELVVGFSYRAENLPRKYKFLAQCQGKILLNKGSRQLEKVEFYSVDQIKVKIFKVDKLDMVQFYQLDSETGNYLITREELLMDVRLFGQQVEVTETNEFMDYVKVK